MRLLPALRRTLLVSACLLVVRAGPAGELGRWIATQVDVESYQDFLDNHLYTHTGDNRGYRGPQHDPARDNIAAFLAGYGLEVELHAFTYRGYAGVNVVATQLGSQEPGTQYLLGAHYDSVNNPGADDDASGVAGLLEIARVLSRYETHYTIRYIAFDLEELGLYGSFVYASEHRDDDIRGMVQLDMIAHVIRPGECDVDIGRDGSRPLREAVIAAIAEFSGGLTAHAGYSQGSDHYSFERYGKQACVVSEGAANQNPCWHKLCDTVDNPGYIDYEFGAAITRALAGFLAEQAGALVPCEGDLNGDFAIELGDLATLLSCMGLEQDCGDLDGDGDTDLADLAILLTRFGQPCP